MGEEALLHAVAGEVALAAGGAQESVGEQALAVGGEALLALVAGGDQLVRRLAQQTPASFVAFDLVVPGDMPDCTVNCCTIDRLSCASAPSDR